MEASSNDLIDPSYDNANNWKARGSSRRCRCRSRSVGDRLKLRFDNWHGSRCCSGGLDGTSLYDRRHWYSKRLRAIFIRIRHHQNLAISVPDAGDVAGILNDPWAEAETCDCRGVFINDCGGDRLSHCREYGLH